MLKGLYEKSEIWFAVFWIAIYCVLMAMGDSFSGVIGIPKLVTLAVGLGLSLAILLFLKGQNLFQNYGLRKSSASAKSMLYYIPVIAMVCVNLIGGISIKDDGMQAVLFILSMLCVGFLEEIIFRGFLFNAMRKSNFKLAVIVCSLTFGIGHVINLINGSGAPLIATLLQICYATTAGFMFIMIYCKTQSLIVCILAHGVFNALSILSSGVVLTNQMQIATSILLMIITGGYAIYLAVKLNKGQNHS